MLNYGRLRIFSIFKLKGSGIAEDISQASMPELCARLAEKTLALLRLIEQKQTHSQEFFRIKREVQELQVEIKQHGTVIPIA